MNIRNKKMNKGILLVFFTLTLINCGTTKTYEGPKLSDSEVSKIEPSNYSLYSFPPKQEYYLLHKSGHKVVGSYFEGYPSEIEVLPGMNSVTIKYYTNIDTPISSALLSGGALAGALNDATEDKKYIDISFSTEPGHTYKIMFYPRSLSGKLETPSPWVVDKETHQVVYGTVPPWLQNPLYITK